MCKYVRNISILSMLSDVHCQKRILRLFLLFQLNFINALLSQNSVKMSTFVEIWMEFPFTAFYFYHLLIFSVGLLCNERNGCQASNQAANARKV